MRAVVVVALVACVEYPRYQCDTYALNIGADATWSVPCDITIAGTSGAHIHADGVIAAPTFDGSTPACTIPPDTFESVAYPIQRRARGEHRLRRQAAGLLARGRLPRMSDVTR